MLHQGCKVYYSPRSAALHTYILIIWSISSPWSRAGAKQRQRRRRMSDKNRNVWTRTWNWVTVRDVYSELSRPGVSGHSSQLEWRMALFRYIYHRFIEIPTIPFCYLNIAHTSVNGNPGVTLSHLHGDRDTFSLIFISILSIWLWSPACFCRAVRLIISIDSSAGGCCGVRKHSVREEAF